MTEPENEKQRSRTKASALIVGDGDCNGVRRRLARSRKRGWRAGCERVEASASGNLRWRVLWWLSGRDRKWHNAEAEQGKRVAEGCLMDAEWQ